MALPTAAIDRLFDRLAMSYGTEFTNKWGTLSSADVKSHWAHELGIFVDNLQAIGWALKNLPDRCPNLIEFKTLCKQAPRPSTTALEAPKAPVEVVDRVLAEIAAKALQTPKDEFGNVDHKRWAKKLKLRHEQGERLSLYQIRCYKSALDLLKETT
jgi:hypothetical protein